MTRAGDRKKKVGMRGRLFIISGSAVALVAICTVLYGFFAWRNRESTDDAYVGGDKIALTPQVSGVVTAIEVDDTDFVRAGEVLVGLNEEDYLLAWEEKRAHLAQTVRDVVGLFIRVEELRENLERQRTASMRSEVDCQNRNDLVQIGGVSGEEFTHKEIERMGARAAVREATYALEGAVARVQSCTVRTHPLVEKAIEEAKRAWIDWRRCHVLSPVSGYIAMRTVQLGEWVDPTTALLAIIPLDHLWVDANFKEVDISKIRIGQPARIRSDLYGRSVVFHGKVVGIFPGTGGTFSLLPPQNATGNWIKIVQRVPVRISLDPEQLRRYPLWPGLSLSVTIDVRDREGVAWAETRGKRGLSTDAYWKQGEGVEAVIEDIIRKNSYDWNAVE